jgi:hypothetical protein
MGQPAWGAAWLRHSTAPSPVPLPGIGAARSADSTGWSRPSCANAISVRPGIEQENNNEWSTSWSGYHDVRLPLGPTPVLGNLANPATFGIDMHRTKTVTEPQIVCPNCQTEIKLTESLAAPLIAETRRQFEQQLAAKEADFGRREATLKNTQEDLAKAREAIDEQVATRLKAERASITETEAKKARTALANDLEQRDRQLAELQQNLTANNAKLAEAQAAQAEIMRKSRELDDAKREIELTVEKKVQESLTAIRGKA